MMKIDILEKDKFDIAHVQSEKLLITDVASAMDLMMNVNYETGCSSIILNKNVIIDDFFILSTGLAGEILQKFINYKTKLAIYGDFSTYTSKPLKDFIYECNKGSDFFFVDNLESAVHKLSFGA